LQINNMAHSLLGNMWLQDFEALVMSHLVDGQMQSKYFVPIMNVGMHRSKSHLLRKKILDISTSLNIETALSRIDAGPGVPLYITHFVEENNVIKYKEAILSQPLLDMLDYNRDALTSYLFTSGGLPHFLSTTEKDRSDLYWVDLRTALSKEVVVSEEHSTYLITKSQEKKPVIEKHYWIYERKKGYPDEAVCIYVYKEDPSRLLPNEPTSNEVLAMHSNDSSQSNRAKDVQAFFKKFYNEDFLDPEAILKSTCAYRILTD